MAEERPRALAAHKPMAPITRSPTGLTSYRAQRIGRELAAYDLPLFNAARFRHNAPRRSAEKNQDVVEPTALLTFPQALRATIREGL